MKSNIFMVALPFLTMALQNGYYISEPEPLKNGYMIHIINETPRALRCQLTVKGKKKATKVTVRAWSKSQKFYFTSIPKLQCKVR